MPPVLRVHREIEFRERYAQDQVILQPEPNDIVGDYL
jgi:hypothetical protein